MMMVFHSRVRGRSPAAPAAPIALSNRWAFYGDSQTQGPAAAPCKSHADAFVAIWNANYTPATTVNIDGSGGQGLANHNTRYNADTHYTNEWVHVQESGGQDEAGQLTAAQFKATFIAFMEAIYASSPSGLITYETAYSFQREAEEGRNWDPYNAAMLEAVSELAARATPINVLVVDADAVIKRLVTALGYAVVNQQSGSTPSNYTVAQAPYHYTEVGNLAIALAIFKRLGYNIRTLDLSSVSTASNVLGRVTTAHVAACIEAADPA
jgi:hypothetical protein